MRIVCPSCAASYDVPDGLLAGRKAVRCARCGEQWTPPPADEPAPPEGFPDPVRPVFVTPEVATPLARLAPPAAMPRRSTGLRLAWVASVVILVAALVAGVVWRDRIAQVWPPSLRVYAALGLAHNPR